MTVLIWILAIVGVLVGFYIAQTIYLAVVLRWEDEQSVGMAYYGRPARGRSDFKRTLRLHARLLAPVLWVNGKLSRLDFRKARIQYQGVSAPAGSCSMESFTHGAGYTPDVHDVFVVTQMKCGTTWMQQIVYEVLHRGRGDLVATGTALYAVSPWLEGRKSVSLQAAPLLGAERPSRLIKTHFPASLCPFDPRARYIYVARHPVSCFASCVDFVRTNVGALAPSLPAFEEWFCTADLMWWGTWTDHVAGWWARAQRESNVLFVHFEEMKRDLPAIVRRVAAFLGVAELSEAELALVVEKSGFSYMRQHQDAFEMHPPHILQTNAALFVSGQAERFRDVPEEVRVRILAWASKQLADSDFPLANVYPDVAGAPAALTPADR